MRGEAQDVKSQTLVPQQIFCKPPFLQESTTHFLSLLVDRYQKGMVLHKELKRFFQSSRKIASNSSDRIESQCNDMSKQAVELGADANADKHPDAGKKKQEVVAPSEAVKVALQFLELVAEHKSIISLFHEKGECHFEEAKMLACHYDETCQTTYRSFPDLKLVTTEEGLEEIEPGIVVVIITAQGTHTGEPYCFGPFPEVEAKGTSVRNDPERLKFHVEDGRIRKLEVEPLGRNTGPPGFYTQVGGLIF